MFIEKIAEEYINEVKENGTYAFKEELSEIIKDVKELLLKKPDSTPEEIIDILIQENIEQLENIRQNYPIPGYNVGFSTGNIKITLVGGNIDAFKNKMPDNALFDIASMTKFYTEIIAYNLIKEGVFHFDNIIQQLDNRFYHLGNLTIRDILTFTTEFRTPATIAECKTINQAYESLFATHVVKKGKYNYNDIGMMIMKEIMETVTGLSYAQLLEKYIMTRANLNDTYLVLPERKNHLFTGSANSKMGQVNDPSALAFGGYSGHAGLKVSNDDLLKLGRKAIEGQMIPKELYKNTYTPGIAENRGIMGNTYTAHLYGVNVSFVDRLAPTREFAIQGSTRVQMNIGPNGISTILFNPASMSLDQAKIEEEKVNKQRMSLCQKPLQLVREYTFDRNGNKEHYNLIDARQMVPSSYTVVPVTKTNTKTLLRLNFLRKVIEKYDKEYANQQIEAKYLVNVRK